MCTPGVSHVLLKHYPKQEMSACPSLKGQQFLQLIFLSCLYLWETLLPWHEAGVVAGGNPLSARCSCCCWQQVQQSCPEGLPDLTCFILSLWCQRIFLLETRIHHTGWTEESWFENGAGTKLMLFDLIRSRDSLMCKREAREVKLFNRWICCTFHAAGSCVQCLSLVYLVSLLVMGTCSGLPTAARSGDSQSFTPQVKSSFWGEAPMGFGCGEKMGGNLARTILHKAKGLGLYKWHLLLFSFCRWLV